MNASELSQRMAEQAAAIAEHLLPKGRKAGSEWKAGSVAGEEGKSLSVRLNGDRRGVWRDFATGDGGDLLDLWAGTRSVSIAEAMADAKAFLGIREHMPTREPKAFKRPERPACKAPKDRVLQWLTGRGIEERVLADFRIGEVQRDGKTFAVFPYIRDGEFVNAKHRNIDDKRDMRQEAGAEPCLFGWHLIDPKVRSVAIAEGEIDAMTLHQVGISALSVNAGAGNHQWIESDWQRLERFSEIFVCFDDDEAGKKGAAEVARRLGIERCRRPKFAAKDANEWLMQGATAEDFRRVMLEAKSDDPEELVRLADFMGQVKALFYPAAGAPMHPLLELGGGRHDWLEFRPGEYTLWTGINGHGKSLMLNQVLLGLMRQGERVMVFSGEMEPRRQGYRLVRQATGLRRPTPAFIDAIGDWVRDRMWIFNIVGSVTIDRLMEVFTYANKRYGITQFAIDSLMMCDVPEDGPGAFTKQKEAVQKIATFCKRTGSHLHLVAHPRKARDESQSPGKMDVAGSGKITDAADNVFSVWSARKEEADPDDGKPDALLELQKQRNGEVQHFRLWLFFSRDAQQYCVGRDRRARPMVDFSIETAIAPEAA